MSQLASLLGSGWLIIYIWNLSLVVDILLPIKCSAAEHGVCLTRVKRGACENEAVLGGSECLEDLSCN